MVAIQFINTILPEFVMRFLRINIFLFAFVILPVMCNAQSYDSIAHHNVGHYDIDLRNMMQLHDGNILANIQLFEIDDQGHYIGDYGNMLLKIAPNGAVLLDSVFVADDDLNYFLIERNPIDKDNIYAKVVRNLDEGHCDLRISFFDDDLNFKPEKEIWVPLYDAVFGSLADSYFLDENGDIMLRFPISERNELHYYRIGIDGGVKNHEVMPADVSPINYGTLGGHDFGVFNEQPAEYYFAGLNHNDLSKMYIHVFDSALVLKETLTPSGAPSNTQFDFGMRERVLDWDAETFMVASRWHHLNSDLEDGVRITRYWKEEPCEALATCYFRTMPQLLIGNFSIGCAFPFGLAKSGDGSLYFAYCTQDPETFYFGTPVGRVSVVKMDADFNIVWQRFCLEPEGYSRVGSECIALEGGGVAVGGTVFGAPPELFFIVFNDEGWNVTEIDSHFRPYSYYPNPVKDQLSLFYSPDVWPSRIELYDLQGRKVLTQSSSLEQLDLQGLSAGQYLMKITLENGRTFTDKVVKE